MKNFKALISVTWVSMLALAPTTSRATALVPDELAVSSSPDESASTAADASGATAGDDAVVVAINDALGEKKVIVSLKKFDEEYKRLYLRAEDAPCRTEHGHYGPVANVRPKAVYLDSELKQVYPYELTTLSPTQARAQPGVIRVENIYGAQKACALWEKSGLLELFLIDNKCGAAECVYAVRREGGSN